MRILLAGIIGMAVAMGIGRFVYTPLLPSMMEGLGLTPGDAGFIASANFLGYLVGAILASGQWGHGREHRVAALSLVATTILTAAIAFMPQFISLSILRFLSGIASAFAMVFLSTIVFGRLAILGRTDLQTFFFAGVGLGIAISSVLTGALSFLHTDWSIGWIGSACLALIGTVICLFLLRGKDQKSTDEKPEPRMPASRALHRMILAYGLFGIGYSVTATFLVAIIRSNGQGQFLESLAWLVVGLAVLPSVWMWNYIRRDYGLAAAFAAGCLVEAVGVLISVAVNNMIGSLIAALLLGGTFVAVTVYGLLAGRALTLQSPRRVVAFMTASFGVGQIIGPLGAGYFAEMTQSYFWPSCAAALCLVLSAAIALTIYRDPALR